MRLRWGRPGAEGGLLEETYEVWQCARVGRHVREGVRFFFCKEKYTVQVPFHAHTHDGADGIDMGGGEPFEEIDSVMPSQHHPSPLPTGAPPGLALTRNGNA
jgi:hypothetical protein